jgi:parallel beta-helix repeat protein
VFTNSDGVTNNPTGKGTNTPVFIKLPLGNVISGNAMNGVLMDYNSENNKLYGNFIGTTNDGTSAVGNTLNGVFINNSNNNSLIGCEFQNNPFVYYNVVSGNKQNGLYVLDSENTIIQANFFGINSTNNSVLPNLDGIKIDGNSINIQLGGVIPLGNVCSGNTNNGINVTGFTRSFTTFNTFGGLFAFGGAAPNGEDGIQITSKEQGNVIRTNVFSGNLGNGINLNNAENVLIETNICGLDTDCENFLPNGKNGILIQGTSKYNVVANTSDSVISRNVLSGNNENGIAIIDDANHNHIIASSIGLKPNNVIARGNKLNGVFISDRANYNIVSDCFVCSNLNDGVILTEHTFNNIISDCNIGYNITDTPEPNINNQVVNLSQTNSLIYNNVYS